MSDSVSINDQSTYTLERKGDQVFLNGAPDSYRLEKISQTRFQLIRNLQVFNFEILNKNLNELQIKINGKEVSVSLKTEMAQMLESMGMNVMNQEKINEIKAPMPGAILDILCQEGDLVKKGDSLLILEAMKMENVIKSPGEGHVSSIKVSKGENVDKNQSLIIFK